MTKKFFKRHQGRGSYDLFSNYAHYLPTVGGMFLLFLLFLVGALLGNLIVLALGLVSSEFASVYGTVISYPVMFIPPLLYASAQSRRNEYFDMGYAVDSNNFDRLGGMKLGLIVSIATIALAFMTDSLTRILPDICFSICPAFRGVALQRNRAQRTSSENESGCSHLNLSCILCCSPHESMAGCSGFHHRTSLRICIL